MVAIQLVALLVRTSARTSFGKKLSPYREYVRWPARYGALAVGYCMSDWFSFVHFIQLM